MCRLMRFYAGGITYEKMETMPLTDFFALIIDSKSLASQEKAAFERSKNGK